MNDEIIGKKIGIYDVMYECEYKSEDGHKLYHCKCMKCGWETNIQKRHISKAQNCRHKGLGDAYIDTKIRWSNQRLKTIFRDMKYRCYNKTVKSYRFYGAKGIGICSEWLNNPLSFEEWALANGYEDNLTIDRIDSSKDYSPDNCRWIAANNNSKYKSTTKLTVVDGVLHTGREWAVLCQLGTNTINKMLREYPKDKVIQFIEERLKNPNLRRHSHQTWFDVYNIK